LTAVRADRALAAETWFNQHAQQWDAIRSLHAAESEVETAMAAMLEGTSLGRLVDVGTGTGRMLALFGASAESAVGIDRNPEMLRLARAKLSDIDGLEFELRQGDVTRLNLDDHGADTILIHQVLHYLPAPELAIQEAARVLAPGGRLLIVDFAPHDHEELRTRDAHARLGFSDAQIADWFSATSLNLVHSATLAGGDLNVKLWLGTPQPATLLKVVKS
jgi:ubiquinone/menaquinone biosynthesis C-methylase UbiE